jgi:hypothetical protein
MLSDATASTTIAVVPHRPLLWIIIATQIACLVAAWHFSKTEARLTAAESALSDARNELVLTHAALWQCQTEIAVKVDAVRKDVASW